MQNFFQDLRFSARTLRKSPGFTLTAILTLALGIGAVTAIFSVVDSILLKPFALPAPGQLIMLGELDTSVSAEPMPDNPRHFFNWQANAKSLSGAAIMQDGTYSVAAGADHPEILNGLKISPNFLSVLGVQPALGRGFLPAEATKGRNDEVILTWNAWQRYFHGDPAVVGVGVGRVGAVDHDDVLPAPQRGEARRLGRPGHGGDHPRRGPGPDPQGVEADAHRPPAPLPGAHAGAA